MVKGLQVFKEHFNDHIDSFVIIGGTACSLLLESAEIPFRVTKDIDMILYIEVLKPDFGKAFWDFVIKGGYQNRQKGSEKKNFYRFFDPTDENYPGMIELLSSKPEGFDLKENSRFTPIPFEEEISSLSAILMDEDYYSFLKAGRQIVDGLPVLSAGHLIPLKAKAFLDLTKRKAEGKNVNSDDIKKHKNDVFRLFQLMTLEMRFSLSPTITEDMKNFITAMRADPVDLKSLKIVTLGFPEILSNLKDIYGL
jgi:hypothetical protein